MFAINIKRIVLHPELAGKLPGPGVGRTARLGGKGNDLRQLGMLGAPLANH